MRQAVRVGCTHLPPLNSAGCRAQPTNPKPRGAAESRSRERKQARLQDGVHNVLPPEARLRVLHLPARAHARPPVPAVLRGDAQALLLAGCRVGVRRVDGDAGAHAAGSSYVPSTVQLPSCISCISFPPGASRNPAPTLVRTTEPNQSSSSARARPLTMYTLFRGSPASRASVLRGRRGREQGAGVGSEAGVVWWAGG